MAKIFLTRKIPNAGLNLLKSAHDVKVFSDEVNPDKEQIINYANKVDALITLLSDEIDEEIINSCKNLKIIANYAVGYDNIDLDAARRNEIYVSNTPGVLTEATADLTWTLLSAMARRIVEADKYLRELKFDGWSPELMLGKSIYAQTLGIVGFGRIGRAVAKRAHGFDMKVLYNKRSRLSNKEEEQLNIKYAKLDELLNNSDYITINASLNESTHHLIGKNEFQIMKDNAVLVNTGRGSIVDEDALANALINNQIFGAGIDVYENEPEVNPKLLKLNNVILTPHIGTATTDARNKMAVMVAKNVIKVLEGKTPINRVT